MLIATASSYQRAIDKATALGTVKTIRQVEANRYLVPGLGAVYTVQVGPDGQECTCKASTQGMACYHSAAVWLRIKSRSMLAPDLRDSDPEYPGHANRPAPARDSDSAPLQHRSGAGIGFGNGRRWDAADDDATSMRDLIGARR